MREINFGKMMSKLQKGNGDLWTLFVRERRRGWFLLE
jgi:hypothetical protein